MAVVGNRKVLLFESLIIPIDEEAEISVPIRGGDIRIKLSFEDVKTAIPEESRLDFEMTDEVLHFRFRNWKNPIPTVIKEPVQIATTDTGNAVYFLLCHWRTGNMNRIDLQFMIDAPNRGEAK